jgi:pimeloyl-ACP methyl ester carboxylesterase
MADYADLDGVRTWYDERAEGEPLALLHGGSVDARFFDKNIDALADRFHVFLPERRGHGHTPDVDGPITYQLMAQDTIAFLEAVVGGPAHLVGHSDGAVAAMLVAQRRPSFRTLDFVVAGGAGDADGGASAGIGPPSGYCAAGGRPGGQCGAGGQAGGRLVWVVLVEVLASPRARAAACWSGGSRRPWSSAGPDPLQLGRGA